MTILQNYFAKENNVLPAAEMAQSIVRFKCLAGILLGDRGGVDFVIHYMVKLKFFFFF